MNIEQTWNSVLEQLQTDMPRASFDTWVRDTKALSCEDGVLTVAVRNAYARDWLESRLVDTVNHMLVGILNSANVRVNFVVAQDDLESVEVETDPSLQEEEEPDDALDISAAAYDSAYEQIVDPIERSICQAISAAGCEASDLIWAGCMSVSVRRHISRARAQAASPVVFQESSLLPCAASPSAHTGIVSTIPPLGRNFQGWSRSSRAAMNGSKVQRLDACRGGTPSP